MPTELINLLIQIPLVGIFVWYSDRMNKSFQEFLREERMAREKQLDALSAEMRSLRLEIQSASQSGHHAKENRSHEAKL